MKKATKLKAFMLSLIMTALLLPMTSFAQQISDSFFCVDDAFNGNRDVFTFNGLYNQTFGNAPLGSGLLVMGALGAGYAIARRKRNKKGAALLLALALTLGFTQCKKKVELVVPVNANKVNITLNVDGRHIVTPGAENATVTYVDGDKIYVGDGTHYIGTLTRISGAFSGEIVEPADGTKIDFFFVGGLEPSVTPTASTTTDFTVNISNQSSNLPVLSCGSAEYYQSTTEYNCELKNKCALVELTLTSGTDAAVGIGDRYTQATINFGGTPGIVPNTETTGMIKMKPSGEDNTKKYAILLPQAAVAGSHIAIGHVGYTLDIPAINANDYAKLSNSSAVASNIVYLNYLTANYTATNGQTLTGTLGENVKISIANNATVTLDGITINGVNNSSYSWAGLNCEGNATIILKDGTTNTVSGFYEYYPGIHVPNGKTLTIQGTGTLNASGSYGAGIGGGYTVNCGNIEIQSGTINASCGGNAAAIGGGRDASCGNITISGGHITAASGWGAGIGSGYAYSKTTSCGNISITGGTIIATGGSYCAGIGSGCNSNCGAITITSGVTSVTATKGSDAYNSIGKGWGSGSVTCGTVTIGGIVFWQSDAYQNGGGDYLTRTTLVYPQVTDLSTITEDYTASFREILTGTLGANVKISIADGATVTLDGVNINGSGTWTSGNYAGITCAGDATIILSGTNTVKGFYKDYPGIQAAAGKTLTINGTGSLTASSNGYSAGIGAGSKNSCGNIEIQGGTITATGGERGAGIGGAYNAGCGNITISGGTVTATGGQYGAGIGGGRRFTANVSCGNILISGGTVTATGGQEAAGIGGGRGHNSGYLSSCGTITITTGVTEVTATKGSDAPNSIGAGNLGTCGTVTIEAGANVTQN
jgi:hypothetical protein